MAGLTNTSAEHERFALEFVRTANQTEAYQIAYPHVSREAAASSATRLMKDAKIQALVRKYREVLSRKYGLDTERLVEEAKKIAFSDITDVVEFDGNSIRLKSSADLPRSITGTIASVKQTQHGVEVKMHDKVKGLELAGRAHGGVFSEKVEHIHSGRIEVDLSEVARDTLEGMKAIEADFKEVPND